MLTKRSFDHALFVVAIVLGFVLCFWAPEKLQELSCGPATVQQSGAVHEQDQTANTNNNKANGAVNPTKEINTNAKQNEPTQINNPPRQSVLCTDLRLTDLALVFFTYCLVIVGWFSLRASERNLETLERAYMFHGYSPLEFRGDQARFTLVMINAGRMPGGVKEVGWKFLRRNDLPPSRSQIDGSSVQPKVRRFPVVLIVSKTVQA
jgi:hypothetical protein